MYLLCAERSIMYLCLVQGLYRGLYFCVMYRVCIEVCTWCRV